MAPCLLVCLLAASLGCTSLSPYEAVIQKVSRDQLLDVRGNTVYVETAGAGEPILLVHGFGGSTYSWRSVMPALAQHHRVVALDLYGFGYTERPRELARYTRRGQLRLMLDVMDALGIESAHVVGHSYGGGLVTTLAIRHPERVRSLVLVDSTAPNWSVLRRRKLAGVAPLSWLFVRGFALRPKLVRRALEHSWHEDGLVTDELVGQYTERLQIEGAVRAYRGLTASIESAAEDPLVGLQQVRQPTLVVWGEEDRLISVADGRLAASLVSGSRFVALPGTGHVPMEEQPEAFVRMLEAFFASLAAPRAGG